MRDSLARNILLAIAGVAIAACGGGSDSGSAPEFAVTPPAASTHPSGLYVVDIATGEVELVAGGDGYTYFGPAWSPNGEFIAVTRSRPDADGELVLLTPGGSFVGRLTRGYLPAWSPDGSQLAFVSQQGDDTATAEIHRIEADGTNEIRLTNNDSWDYGATWTRDGSEVIFGSQTSEGWRLLIVPAGGGTPRALPTEVFGNAPALSSDGRLIAFTSDRDGDDDIYATAVSGGDQRNLTANTAHDDNATWSPDGSRIAFSSDASGKNEIYVMEVDRTGSNSGNVILLTVQVTNDPALAPDIPTWSPDGMRIAFAARAANR
jgi:Tol biopolymer transport system component